MKFDMQALVFINSFKFQVFRLFLHFLINSLDFPFYRSSQPSIECRAMVKIKSSKANRVDQGQGRSPRIHLAERGKDNSLN